MTKKRNEQETPVSQESQVVTEGDVRVDRNAHVCLVVKVGREFITYLALRGCELARLRLEKREFLEQFRRPAVNSGGVPVTKEQFVAAYMPASAERYCITISSPAAAELAVLSGQPDVFRPYINSPQLNEGGQTMSTKKAGAPRARKTDGAVATVRNWLDQRYEKIKSGDVTRSDVTKALTEKGINTSTISVQVSKWCNEKGLIMAGGRGNPIEKQRKPRVKKEKAAKTPRKPRVKKAEAEEAVAAAS